MRKVWPSLAFTAALLFAGLAQAQPPPLGLSSWVRACAQVHQVDEALLWAVMRVESGTKHEKLRFGPMAEGTYSGPCGLRRADYGPGADVWWLNVAMGAETLARLLRRTHGSVKTALDLYNVEDQSGTYKRAVLVLYLNLKRDRNT